MSHLLTTDRLLLEYLKSRFTQAPRPEWTTSEVSPNLMGKISNMDACDYLRLFPNDSVKLIITDEPYGVAPTRINLKMRSDIATDFYWDKTQVDKLDDVYQGLVIGKNDGDVPRLPAHLLNEWVFEAARVLDPLGLLVNFGNAEFTGSFRDVCRVAGLRYRASIPWLKTNVAPHFRKNNFRSGHETIFFASKGVTKGVINFQEQQEMVNFIIDQICPNCKTSYPVVFSNKYDYPRWFENIEHWGEEAFEISSIVANKKTSHGTEKPEWIIVKYMTIASNKGDLVVDPYVGSGTTAAVAQRLGRVWSANDLSPEYVEWATKRVQLQSRGFI